LQFYIYRHILDGKTIYVGSNWFKGDENRAYASKGRGTLWNKHLKGKPYEVEIIEYIEDDECPSKKTLAREKEIIKSFKEKGECIANRENIVGYINKGRVHSLGVSIKHTLVQRGKPMSDETKQKIKKNARPGKGGKVETYKVRYIETGKIYDNLQRACEDTGAAVSNIRKVILGQRKTAGGFRWGRV
jgi:hypothetical protein